MCGDDEFDRKLSCVMQATSAGRSHTSRGGFSLLKRRKRVSPGRLALRNCRDAVRSKRSQAQASQSAGHDTVSPALATKSVISTGA